MPSNHTRFVGKIENPLLVYNRKTFAQMMTHLSKQRLIALDTESDSLFRYFAKVCLIQITTFAEPTLSDPARVLDYLVDPLRIEDIRPLQLLLADAHVEKVMHAAENDILVLQRSFAFTVQNVFDTQLAARVLGWKRLGLASILEEQFGVVTDKRMQRTDWGKRPLTPQQIAYAQMDTHYLPALRTMLMEQLQAKNRWEEAQDAFTQLNRLASEDRGESERTFWSMKGIREVPRTNISVLATLWAWREKEAQIQDRPPFKIMGDEILVQIAQQTPRKLHDLQGISGLSPLLRSRYGEALVTAVREGIQQPAPTPPPPSYRPEQQLDERAAYHYERLRQWRTRIATAREVTPDMVFTNEALAELARRRPQSEAELSMLAVVTPWKAQTYGAELLTLLRKGN
jgi:ribonuclease D